MNKLETKHFKVIDDTIGVYQLSEDSDPIMISGKEVSAFSCAEITKEYAEKFAEWIRDNTIAEGTPKLYHRKSKKYLTTSELWDLFLNDLNEKA